MINAEISEYTLPNDIKIKRISPSSSSSSYWVIMNKFGSCMAKDGLFEMQPDQDNLDAYMKRCYFDSAEKAYESYVTNSNSKST